MSSTDQTAPQDPASSTPAPALTTPRRLWLWAGIAAAAAGLSAWLVGESPVMRVAPRQVGQTIFGQAFAAQTADTIRAADVATAARMYGAFGGLLGLGLGAVGGLASRSSRSAGMAMLTGTVLGTVAGSISSVIAVPLYHRFHESIPSDLIASMLVHGAVWGSIGASSALAFAVGLGRGWRSVFVAVAYGLLSALLATAFYEVAGAVIFPTDETGEPISQSSVSRLFARLIVALCIGIGSAAAFGTRRARTAATIAQ